MPMPNAPTNLILESIRRLQISYGKHEVPAEFKPYTYLG
jgi:hypothetical protein